MVAFFGDAQATRFLARYGDLSDLWYLIGTSSLILRFELPAYHLDIGNLTQLLEARGGTEPVGW